MTPSPDNPTQRIRQLHAERLRAARDMEGMTREQLAEAIRDFGIDATTSAVIQWERGAASPRWATSVAIAQALGVVWSNIFGLDGITL